MSEIFIPTEKQMKRWFKDKATTDFFVVYGDDQTGGHTFIPYMLKFQFFKPWHILAVLITSFAIVGGYFIEGDNWALAFLIPIIAYYMASYLDWSQKKKGKNPDRLMRDTKGERSLAWFVMKCHNGPKPFPKTVAIYLLEYRPLLLGGPNTYDPKFWDWLSREW